jgi:hypothetical protein
VTISASVSPADWICLEPAPTRPTLSSISSLISYAALALRCARVLTSEATTAKPRPCSPARAASTAALSAVDRQTDLSHQAAQCVLHLAERRNQATHLVGAAGLQVDTQVACSDALCGLPHPVHRRVDLRAECLVARAFEIDHLGHREEVVGNHGLEHPRPFTGCIRIVQRQLLQHGVAR